MGLIHHVTPSIFLSGETSLGRVKGYPLILAGDMDTTSPMKAAFAAALGRKQGTPVTIATTKDKKDHA